MGYSSLFEFAIRALNYSEAQAQRRISAMRLMREIPQIEEKIESGVLSLTNLSMAQSYFRQAKKTEKTLSSSQKLEVLELLENKSTRECERELIKLSPLNEPKESERLITEDLTEYRMVVKSGLKMKLEKLKSLMSHKNPNPNLSELVEMMADVCLKKLDPEKKRLAQSVGNLPTNSGEQDGSVCSVSGNRLGQNLIPSVLSEAQDGHNPKENKEGFNHSHCGGVSVAPKVNDLSEGSERNILGNGLSRGRYISVQTKSQVWARDKGQCTYNDSRTGRACGSKHLLQFDHVEPFALGGAASIENLRLLCASHNRLRARKTFGVKYQ